MFANKAAAQAHHPVVGPDFIQLAGYNTSGDGGEALYVKNGTSTGNLVITLSDGVTNVGYSISNAEIAPEAYSGARDLAGFSATLAAGVKRIKLTAGATYTLSAVLNIDSAVDILLNGATIQAAAVGFTDDNLLNFTAGNIRIFGPGILDGRNLPKRTTDFIGTDFVGFTLKMNGTFASPLNNIVLKDLTVIAGDTSSVAAAYCHDLTVSNVMADGAYTNLTYDTGSLLFFNNCNSGQYHHLRLKAVRCKGISINNSKYFNAYDMIVQTNSNNNAAIFASGSSNFTFDGVKAVGGFGVKMDTCSFGGITNVEVDGGGIAVGCVYLQGCNQVYVRHGDLRNFVNYGAIAGGHPVNGVTCRDIGFEELVINGAATKGDLSAGYYFENNATYGTFGIQIKGGLVRTVDCGILSSGAAAMSVDNIDVDGVRFQDIKSYAWYGPSQSLNFKSNAIEASPTLNDAIRVWSAGVGTRLIVDDNEGFTLGTNANFLIVSDSAGTPVSYDQVSFTGNRGRSGARPLNINLAQASARVNSLSAQNNNWFDSNNSDAFSLSNASGVNVQVNMIGNSLLSTSNSKKDIRFNETAASGRWNGIVANNMAGVINTPNNV